MDLPLVSFVMPVYNAEKYLKEAIDSVLQQSYKNIELVIINDGSTDSSKDIILANDDPRIRYFENKFNSGIVFSRNRGLQLAIGDYIATLDSDDIALPHRTQLQVDFLEKNSDYGMCGTFYHTIDSKGTFLKKIVFPTDNRDLSTYLILGNCFCNSTIMIRSQLGKELKYEEKYYVGEDYELWYRVSKKAKIANLPIIGTHYRIHGNNISVAKMNDMFALVKKINRQILVDLNIDFSQQELEIHSNFLLMNTVFFQDNATYRELENWALKLDAKLKNEKKYNYLLFYKMIAEKWIIISFNTKRYKKLLYNKLFQMNRGVYLSVLAKRVYRKITKD